MKPIDVHVLLSEGSSPFHSAFFESMDGQDCNLFKVEGIPGHIGEGRVLGFQQGSSQYVSFVDDDDVVEPGAFARMRELIDMYPGCGMYISNSLPMGEYKSQNVKDPRHKNPFFARGLHRWEPMDDPRIETSHILVFEREKIARLFEMYKRHPRGGDAIAALIFIESYPFATTSEVLYRKRVR